MPIATLLANYANLTLYLAMAVLTIAMIAFAVHVAFAQPATHREAVEPELVTAGASGSRAASGGGATAGVGLADAPTADSALATDSPRKRERGQASGQWGVTLSWLGALLLVASVVLRGASVHRAPVGNMFEFAVFGSMLVMLVYLGLSLRWPLRWLGLFVVLPVLLTLGLALTVWYAEAAELLPSLKSIWLAIHVPVATLSVAVFTIAFSVLLLHLAKGYRQAHPQHHADSRVMGFLDQLPSAATLDRTAYSLHVVAFPLWTFSLIAGAIWAQQAWGSYWNWDPKEVWTFVIWVIYAAYLHARATSGWSLRTANILAIVGYLAIVVNFAIVNVFFIGQHSYSGLG